MKKKKKKLKEERKTIEEIASRRMAIIKVKVLESRL